MAIFVDTSVFLAAIVRRDQQYAAGRALLQEIADGRWGRPVTSRYVILEALNWLRARTRTPDGARLFHGLVFGLDGQRFIDEVLDVDAAAFASAYERYLARRDAGLSLGDWSHVALMEQQGIKTIATFDQGFEAWVEVVRAA